jgi:hypothetical protein
VTGNKPSWWRQKFAGSLPRDWPVLSVDKARKGTGFGLRTTATTRRGDVLVEYLGECVTEAERLRRPPSRYTVWLEGKKTCIDAEESGSLARFANNACTHPNTTLEWFEIDGVQRVFLVATKNIPGGAWLTLNYAQEPMCLTTVEGSFPPCFCGRRECTGFIGATARENAWKVARFAQRIEAERRAAAKRKQQRAQDKLEAAQLEDMLLDDAQPDDAQATLRGRRDDAAR